jgi:hypothetical protein
MTLTTFDGGAVRITCVFPYSPHFFSLLKFKSMAIKVQTSNKRGSNKAVTCITLSEVNGHHDTEKIEFEAEDGVISIRAFTTDENGDEFGTIIRLGLTEAEFNLFLDKTYILYRSFVKNAISKLGLEVRRFKALKSIHERTVEKGLNGGKGYTYLFVRRVVYTQECFNEEVIDTAIEIVKERMSEEEAYRKLNKEVHLSVAQRIEETLAI